MTLTGSGQVGINSSPVDEVLSIVDELKKHKVIIEKQQDTIDKQQVIIDDLARRLGNIRRR